MENSTINPVPPSLEGLIWRAISRDDLAVLVELAGACHLAAAPATNGSLTNK